MVKQVQREKVFHDESKGPGFLLVTVSRVQAVYFMMSIASQSSRLDCEFSTICTEPDVRWSLF